MDNLQTLVNAHAWPRQNPVRLGCQGYVRHDASRLIGVDTGAAQNRGNTPCTALEHGLSYMGESTHIRSLYLDHVRDSGLNEGADILQVVGPFVSNQTHWSTLMSEGLTQLAKKVNLGLAAVH